MDLGELLRTNRRAAIVRGGQAATAMATLAGLGIGPAEAKKKKKKKKKKNPPPQVVATVQAATMTGAKEVPPEDGDPLGSGSGTCDIKSNGEICCDFTFNTTTVDSVVSGVHIHQGNVGTEDPGTIVVSFGVSLETCVKPGQATLDAIISGPPGFYANIHTNKFPNGAVRDQLL